MQNNGLDEAQPGIKTARRNIDNLRYADDTTLMAESEEELKSLSIKVKDDAVKVLHSICQLTWKTQQWPQDWKRSVFIPIPKDRQCQRMFKLPYNCTHITC